MKRYITKTEDTCWTDCLACMLEIKPSKVPKFVKLYKNSYMDKTRQWLAENFGKGIVYTPARAFMETGGLRQNPPIGPAGHSIALLGMVDPRATHVVIAFNGGVLYDNNESREDEYGQITGYFTLYDLEPEKARKILVGGRGKKRHVSRKL